MQFGDIYAVELPPVGGHEQAGYRPAVIVQSGAPPYDALSTVVVVPFTSQLKAQAIPGTLLIVPDTNNGLRAPSVALVLQIRVLDRRRIRRRLGQLSQDQQQALREELQRLLTLDQ